MNTNIAYGFLDESSSLMDEAIFFCVSIISTNEKVNKRLQNIIKHARQRIVKKKLKSLHELKFHGSDEKTRIYVLSELAKHDVKIVVMAVDKQGRRVTDNPENYGMIVGATVVEFLSLFPVLRLTVDKKFTSTSQQEEFLTISQETINKIGPKGANIFFNAPMDSKKESLIQLADFVAGAMNVKYNQNNSYYADLIKERIIKETAVRWTNLKKRIVNP